MCDVTGLRAGETGGSKSNTEVWPWETVRLDEDNLGFKGRRIRQSVLWYILALNFYKTTSAKIYPPNSISFHVSCNVCIVYYFCAKMLVSRLSMCRMTT